MNLRRASSGWQPLVTVAAGSRRHRWLRVAAVTLAVVVAAGIPLNSRPVVNAQLTLVMVYAVAAVGLNLLIGYAGQISLGHGGFFAIGAYAAAILIADHGWHYLPAVLAAGVLTYAVGFAFGVPALRLHGLYLALVTLALALAVGPLIRRMSDLTGGAQGKPVPQPDVPAGLPLDSDQFRYLVTLLVAGVMVLLAVNLTRGGLGRTLRSVRDHERATTTMGTNAAWTKTQVFAWSAAYAGVAGALFALAVGFVAPEAFNLALSFTFLVAIVVGGLGTIAGALLGGLFIQFVPQYAGEIDPALTGIVYGATLIAIVFVLPTGAAGLLRSLWRRVVAVVELPPDARRPGAGAGAGEEVGAAPAAAEEAEEAEKAEEGIATTRQDIGSTRQAHR